MMLTERQDLVMAAFIAEENGGEAADYIGDSDATRDPLEAFDGREWREVRSVERSQRDGFPAIYAEAAQAQKGQPRVSVWVVDFGEVRGVFQM